jgi:4-hydroxy-tetrahydrodipicolinate reductase
MRTRRNPGTGPHTTIRGLAVAVGRPVEARGAEVAGTRIHSVRLPSFVVTTEIIFGGAGERLVMRHDPGETPDPYVAGLLLAIRKAADVPGVRRGLDSLLIDPATGP